MSNSCQTAYLSVYVSMTNLVAPIGLCAIAPEKKYISTTLKVKINKKNL